MSPRKHRLSKSRFTAGVQCHRRLWWAVHDPRAPELQPDPELQARFDMGTRVGKRAREEFPGATLIDFDYRRPLASLRPTRDAIRAGAPAILEAGFFEDDIFVAVDALSREGDGWVLTEVKATTRVKPQHIPDAAVQAHVVEKAGLRVTRVELMHLNREHRHPDDGPLFIRADITDDVAEQRVGIHEEARGQMRMLVASIPLVEPGEQCSSPYECPFLDRCVEPLFATPHPLEELNGIREETLQALYDAGVESIPDIPDDFPLNELWSRHRRAILEDRLIVEPGLHEALAEFHYPIAMLDFETVAPALPVWDGCSPFGAVPVQFSVHTLHEDGRIVHHDYLAEGKGDPRPAVATALAAALADAETVLAWSASTERRCIAQLAEAAPDHADALRAAHDRVQDLLPIVKKHVYHPAFHGSFSIKAVAPALIPGLGYDDLDIADGQTASNQLETLLCRPEELSAADAHALRAELRAYCERDTEVMLALWRRLHP